ncbi:MAG: YaiI/YqxD family protein [Salinispira sp.]
MKILVDADSCPARIRQIIIRAAVKQNIPALFVAARPLPLPCGHKVRMIQVEAGDDAADREILRLLDNGDLIITRDIPLTAELVERGNRVINDRGVCYTQENIRPLLSQRHSTSKNALNTALGTSIGTSSGTGARVAGIGSGERSFSSRDAHNFAAAFDRELQASSKKQNRIEES